MSIGRTLRSRLQSSKECWVDHIATPQTIVHLRSGFLVGGPENLILSGLAAMPPDRFRSVVASFVLPNVDNKFLIEATRRGIPSHPIPITGSFDSSAILSVRKLIQQERASLFVAHDYRALAIALLARWPLARKLPLVAVAHGWTGVSLQVRLYEQLERFLFRFADRVVAVSEPKLNELRSLGLGSRLVLIENGVAVPTEQEISPTSDLRQRLGISEGTVLIGTVGRLSKEKGHAVLIEALARLRSDAQHLPPFHLVIVGDGIERDALKKLVADHHLEKIVSLIGWHTEMASIYRALDLFVLPSYTEGLPMALLEAMAFGTPSIASAVGGCVTVIEDGTSGLLVPAGVIDPLSFAVRELLSEKAKRAAMAAAARQRVIDRYSLQRYTKQFTDLFNQLLPSSAR